VFAWTEPMGFAASRLEPPRAFEARDLRWSRQTREVVPKQAPAVTIEAAVEGVDGSEDASAVIQLCGAGGCGGGR
jgi:hypothetical protein